MQIKNKHSSETNASIQQNDLKTLNRVDAVALSGKLSELSKTALGVVHARTTYGNAVSDEIKDPLGQKLLKAVNYSPKALSEDISLLRQVLVPTRTRIMDNLVGEFIKNNDGSAIIVNLGSGLCTRYERLLEAGIIKGKNTTWINIDLPNMIALRQTLWRSFSQDTNTAQINMPFSVFSEDWMAYVSNRASEEKKSILFVAEGVLGYYEKEDVTSFLAMLQKNFKASSLLLTTVHPIHKEREKNKDYMHAKHGWFVSDSSEIPQLLKGIRIVSEAPFLNKQLLNLTIVPEKILKLMETLPENYSSAVMVKFE